MTDAHGRGVAEVGRANALRAGVPSDASRIMAGETPPVLRSQIGNDKAEASNAELITLGPQNILYSYKSTVQALAAAIDAKDHYAHDHSHRVSEYALLEASSLGLSKDATEIIEYAAILHDIGKAYISDKILLKPGPLNAAEWNIMRKHPVIGADILKDIPFLKKASKLVRHHHERYDGKGYPDGLKGEAIPIGARLIAVADAFDTLTTHHSYQPPCDAVSAMKELLRLSGTQFCPVAVRAFISGFPKFRPSPKSCRDSFV